MQKLRVEKELEAVKDMGVKRISLKSFEQCWHLVNIQCYLLLLFIKV